jgi:hypothetical protein
VPASSLTIGSGWGKIVKDWAPAQSPEIPKSGPVAQLGARFHGMEEVVGSIPTRSTIFAKPTKFEPAASYPLAQTPVRSLVKLLRLVTGWKRG